MRLLTQGEVEESILALSDALEAETYEYAELSDTAATTEADYKIGHARAMIQFASDPEIKVTASVREARVDRHCAEQLRTWKLAEARRQSKKESLLSLRARLDAFRTLSANLRSQT